VIQQYFPATVELAAFSMAVALIMELALVLSASRPGTIFDMGGCLELLLMLPIFWAGCSCS